VRKRPLAKSGLAGVVVAVAVDAVRPLATLLNLKLR
jgi:hypothetical protein